jgi:hypothetical protein
MEVGAWTLVVSLWFKVPSSRKLQRTRSTWIQYIALKIHPRILLITMYAEQGSGCNSPLEVDDEDVRKLVQRKGHVHLVVLALLALELQDLRRTQKPVIQT